MTETAPRDAAQDAIAITSETMGHDFLAALLAELRQMPDHWARLNEQKQQAIIERVKEKIRGGIDRALQIFMRGEFPAVQADLKSIAWENGIKATLQVPKDALYRHALCDAQGGKVLIVLTNADRWTNRMDEIKAKGDQIDLFDGDYDPSIDQPGYRRDRDATALAGRSWEALKKKLQGPTPVDAPKPEGDETNGAIPATEPPKDATDGAADETKAPDGETLLFGTAATEEQERTAKLRILQEQLTSVGIGISLGALQAFTAEQITATSVWAEAYAAAPDSCKIARPLWLPIPDKGE